MSGIEMLLHNGLRSFNNEWEADRNPYEMKAWLPVNVMPILSEELEQQIVERFLPALPDDHYVRKLYQEVLRLREERKISDLIVGSITVDEKGGSIQFRFQERT